MIDKEKIKKEIITGDGHIRYIYNHDGGIAIDKTIELAIKKTIREANTEKEIIYQKLIEDLKQYEKENIDTVRQSRLFAVMLNDIVEIINKRFGIEVKK